MPMPVALIRVVRELNRALTDAGRGDLALSSDAWVARIHEYRAGLGFPSFLEDVVRQLPFDDADGPDPEGAAAAIVVLLADVWDATRDEGDASLTAHETLTIATVSDHAATHPGFLRAVADMCDAALLADEPALLLVPQDWAELVLHHLPSSDVGAFVTEAVYEPLLRDASMAPGGSMPAPSVGELNEWLSLATAIWNNTPQPDRGFRTAIEIASDGEAARQRKAARSKRKGTRRR